MKRLFPTLLLATAALALAACAGTSAPFRAAASVDGPLLADDLTAYVQKDTTLDTATRTLRASQIAQLRDSTADRATIALPSVVASWSQLRGVYAAYVAADPALTDIDRAIRQRTAQKFDDLITGEQSRQAIGLVRP